MVYSDIFEVLRKIEDELGRTRNKLNSTSNIRGALYRATLLPKTAKDKFDPIGMPDGTIGLMPRDQRMSLYRGQCEDKPCVSKLYRRNPDESQMFLYRIKSVEFELVLRKHPAAQDLVKDGFHVNFLGLAQHYGFETELLDLTSDPYVAAFFSVCQYCESEKRYVPVLQKDNQCGVLYKSPVICLTGFSNNDIQLEVIGLQPFKRPGVQRAYAYRLEPGREFPAHVMRFRHSKDSSERIYDKFEGGKRLFPEDKIAEKAASIKSAKRYSREAFQKAYKRYDFQGTESCYMDSLKRSDIRIITGEPNAFSTEEIELFTEEWNTGGKIEFDNQINPRPVLEYHPSNQSINSE